MKKITINDVAKAAGVSKSTVSQYLNKRYKYMSEETKQKIEKVIKELDYTPNTLARSLKQKKTKTVGVIVANIIYSFSTHMVRSIEDELQKHGYNIIVCNGDDNPEKEKKYIDTLLDRQVDGLIIFPTGKNVELYQKLLDSNIPFVFVDRIIEDVYTTSVLLDNRVATKMAVDCFVENGHKSIAIVTLPLTDINITPRYERVEGYKAALEKNGLEVREELAVSVPLEKIPAALDKLFALEEPPTGIIAGNDIVLEEILKYVKYHNLEIPDDIGIIGIDNIPVAELYNPTIITISQPVKEMGKKAAQVVLNAISGKQTVHAVHRFLPILNDGDSV